jgi:hypothetical protein
VTVIDNIGNYKKLTEFIRKGGNSAKEVRFLLNIQGKFGIIPIAIEMAVLAENRTFSYQQIHAKKVQSQKGKVR